MMPADYLMSLSPGRLSLRAGSVCVGRVGEGGLGVRDGLILVLSE